uniref:Uncharacterized protein n=1 Tax=Setaria italica TaxID=4555 RepID=K3Y4B0_SETIT
MTVSPGTLKRSRLLILNKFEMVKYCKPRTSHESSNEDLKPYKNTRRRHARKQGNKTQIRIRDSPRWSHHAIVGILPICQTFCNFATTDTFPRVYFACFKEESQMLRNI